MTKQTEAARRVVEEWEAKGHEYNRIADEKTSALEDSTGFVRFAARAHYQREGLVDAIAAALTADVEPQIDPARREKLIRAVCELLDDAWGHGEEVNTKAQPLRNLAEPMADWMLAHLSALRAENERLRAIILADGLDPDAPIPPGLALRLQRAEVENERLRRDLDTWVYRVDDPGTMHLHYDGCPFKPYADRFETDIPDPRPECTCARAHMAAYWKGQWMLERSSAHIENERLRGALAGIKARLGCAGDNCDAQTGLCGHCLAWGDADEALNPSPRRTG
jgi:hypothetical protein